jgi:Anti-sigma-K factor rskA
MASVNRADAAEGTADHRARVSSRQAAGVLVLAAIVALAVVLAGSGGGRGGSEHVSAGFSGAKASLHRAGAHDELVVSGMPAPPIGEVYEVWINRAGRPPQATDALFTVASDGGASVEIPGRLRGTREVMVTAEPLGGSARPTSVAVLRAMLTGGH